MPRKLRRHEDEDFEASENDNFDNQIGDHEEVKGNIGSKGKERIDQSDEEEIISDEEGEEDVLSAGDDHEDEESDQASEEFKTNKRVLKAESKKGETVSARNADASKQPPKPVWKYNESSSDDDDDAPEEVGTAAKKQETLDLYKIQKEAAIATKRRKRKQRTVKVEGALDKETLNLLSMNEEVLSAVTTSADDKPKSKVIHLTTEDLNPTQTVEKKVDGFKLVSLPKAASLSLGKPINSDILLFQKKHFYGKNKNRVDAGSYISKLFTSRRH